MVDVENPRSMHHALSARQPLTVPGSFSHSSHNPHMYGDSRNQSLSRASASGRPVSRGASHSQAGWPREAAAYNASNYMNAGPPSSGQPPTQYGARLNHTTAGQAGPANRPSQHKSNNSTIDLQRLVGNEHNSHRSRSQPTSPPSRRPSYVSSEQNSHRRQSSTGTSIVPYLQIPATINDSKGSLAEFAAQITCLFWFDSSHVLQRVEHSKDAPCPATPLVTEAIPSLGFRKWVITILSTTQVTQNVILLALLFIYRLKKMNPTVKGKSGSEFRLLTVALMLGNKFLDDNTYTNKTWAEVSGISVQEIHIMEVEFLSNMRYSLFTSKEEWAEWQTKLGRFWTYFDEASRAPREAPSRLSGPAAPLLKLPHALPSPPSSNHASPPLAGTHSPLNPVYSHHSQALNQRLPPALPSPAVSIPDLAGSVNSRKRSYDDASQEPAQKRVLRSTVNNASLSRPSSLTPLYTPGVGPQLPHLPAPMLSISSGPPPPPPHPGPYPATSSAQLAPTGGRAMSMVYPPQPHMAWPPGPLTPTTTTTTTTSSSVNITRSSQSASIPAYDQLRRQSLHPTDASTSSPTSGMSTGQILSQAHSSPSYFLSHRNSPYRPVRGVSTLLVSPPSAAVQNAPHHLSLHQMHYHPLAKARTEYKTGVVPIMVNHETWSSMYQPQNWPPMPQPNFNT